MHWQKKARFAIAAFVIVFAAVVFLAMRRNAGVPPAPAESPRTDPDTVSETRGPVKFDRFVAGRLDYSLEGRDHKAYPDGRQELVDLTLKLPDRNGRTLTITGRRGEVFMAEGQQNEVARAKVTGSVRLVTSDGITVESEELSHDEASGVLTIPGAVAFSKGRLRGKGVGATYDRPKDVLWILDQARIDVSPDESGAGAAEATAGAAGLARSENYLKLTRPAHVVSDGRTFDSDEMTVLLQSDGETISGLQLRGNSRIVDTGAGAQNMSARDIDLRFAEDGRTLQGARLMEQAVLDLPGSGNAGSRRIGGQTIDFALAPDGTTVTSLTASGNVVTELPGDPGAGRRIESTALAATGPPERGVEQLTFDGPVVFRETRAAARGVAAVDRTARARRLIVATQPGLGSLERADFRGNVHIRDGTDLTAGAPRAVHHLDTGQIELSPLKDEPGPAPFVNDGQVLVEARHIRLSPESRRLLADTDVRSTIRARRTEDTPGGREARLPSMLTAGEPVTVTASRLDYDGESVAKYDGNARLWQDKSKIYADSIVIDDRTGNLTARGNTRTTMLLDDVDPKTKQRSARETNATADVLVYDEAKRLATYTSGPTGRAHIVGAQGDLTADRTELYLREGGKELERAVSDGSVVVKEGERTSRGGHLVYTAATDTYVMTGKPVEIIEKEASGCKQTVGAKLTFNRSNESVRMENDGLQLVDGKSIPCPAELRG
ncbi:MAG TPA: hypothetical protein VD833_06625 [Vicinamibacterales bacterium]|nr:hypothetical protein [Vicinamibacterales bacterium]